MTHLNSVAKTSMPDFFGNLKRHSFGQGCGNPPGSGTVVNGDKHPEVLPRMTRMETGKWKQTAKLEAHAKTERGIYSAATLPPNESSNPSCHIPSPPGTVLPHSRQFVSTEGPDSLSGFAVNLLSSPKKMVSRTDPLDPLGLGRIKSDRVGSPLFSNWFCLDYPGF